MAADPLPMVDAHAHFWNLETHYYPWLCDPNLVPFRYGDYSNIRRNYLPEDYRRDCANARVVALVHVEAEHDPKDPVGETRWLAGIAASAGLPSACVCAARLDRPGVDAVLAARLYRAGHPIRFAHRKQCS